MIRGTTPTLVFNLPISTVDIDTAFVTISQHGEIIIDKALEECSTELNSLKIELTQEETLLLACDCIADIQVRVKTNDGYAAASRIIKVRVDKILKDGVI